MKEFIELRRKAREKRDLIIGRARKDYNETLVRIAALEQDLLGREVSTHKPMSQLIERCIPTDREFTTVDVLTALEALDPTRVWRRRSIDNHFHRLRDKGRIKRVRTAKLSDPAIYVLTSLERKPRPLEGLTLLEAIRETIGGRALNTNEIIVGLLEAGYETSMKGQQLRNHVNTTLRKNGFRREGSKWAAE